MYHGYPDRRGVSADMPAVHGTPRVVHRLRLDGKVYASPIVAGGVIVVATEHDVVYGFDRDFKQLWKRTLGTPASAATELPCGNIDPLGITGTPIASGSTV